MTIQSALSLDPVSNRATLRQQIRFIDGDTGELLDCNGLFFVFNAFAADASDPAGYWSSDPGYSSSPPLQASTVTGEIVVVDLGVIEITIAASKMRAISPRNYNFGLTVKSDDEDISEPLIGSIQIIEGYVRTP